MHKKTTILLAEDEPALGQIIKESLETRDFQVLLYENGEKAFNGYKEEWRQQVDQYSSFLDGMNPYQQLAFATASDCE